MKLESRVFKINFTIWFGRLDMVTLYGHPDMDKAKFVFDYYYYYLVDGSTNYVIVDVHDEDVDEDEPIFNFRFHFLGKFLSIDEALDVNYQAFQKLKEN